MSAAQTQPSRRKLKYVSWIRPQDFAWLLFIVVLIITAPDTSNQALILLPMLGAFQVLEPRFPLFASKRGVVISIVLKMILCYLLIGWTHGIDSYYSMIFLVPVVSAATSFDLFGVILVTGIASVAYFSFLLPVYLYYSNDYDLPPDQLGLMSLRVAFYAIVAFLVYEQARAKRDEMKRTEEAAARLAESNLNLQRAEASLRRSERLAALGQLTAGLAHELRNPLGTIKASAEMLTKETVRCRPEVMSEMAGYIGSEVDRMNGLVSSFLDFARPLQIHPVSGDLQQVVSDVLRDRKEQAENAGVRLSSQFDSTPLKFIFDPDLLKLAVSNLVQNAIQASSPNEEVQVRAVRRNGEIILFVSDKGSGIQPEHLENIFNPFFTTKPQGTGLGLAIVSKIVDEHRGKINVFSAPGEGTTFEMILPEKQAA